MFNGTNGTAFDYYPRLKRLREHVEHALHRARGKGGKPDPKLEALLARNAQKLKEKQEMAKLESDS